MSTVADELLNDFGSSGDEAEEVENGLQTTTVDAMDVDVGEDQAEEDSEEASKARIEKMQLGAVKDVRSVASLMATLEPVLEVILPTMLTHSLH